MQLLRDLGSAISPFNAFLISQGLETLSLRIERHVENARASPSTCEARAEVTSVAYAGLPASPWYERGQKSRRKGAGAIVAFEIAGGVDAGKRFVDALNCTATSPTSATCVRSSSTRPRRRTPS